jgi:hypothetical protein
VIKRLSTVSGRKWATKQGWFYLSLGGVGYRWHLCFGRLSVALAHKYSKDKR